MQFAIEKLCLACNKTIRGRSDKKFCNDSCRNCYNNQRKPCSTDTIRLINSVLLKNRKILMQLVREDDRKKTSREQLSLLGFVFSYYTHCYTNKKGGQYFFCYDYGWLDLNDSVLVVKSSMNC
jgi:hypothetical protein